MPHPTADRNLLFGILALQMDFISRDQLITAMGAWVLDKAKPLGQILHEQGALRPDNHALLDALVRRHLEMHGNDAERSLAALSSVGSARDELRQFADPDLQASLMHLATARPAEDPYATRAPSVGAPSSSGLRFRILRPYAKGGLGQVSVALDEELKREVALKEIQDQHADDPQSRARFLLEAEVTGGLEHPGIVPVYGLGTYADGRPFYVMRFIKGDSLKDAIERFHRDDGPGRDSGERTLGLRQLLGRFLDVCNAVAYAHSRGVLHRDLKPGNVMLGPYGETLVVDWGLAKPIERPEALAGTTEAPLRPSPASGSAPTQMGTALGTPAYMSPEQAAGRLGQLGPASDVYSLGATLYCLLTGRAPFEDADLGVVLQNVQRGAFAPPRQRKRDVPPALEAICLKAMALEPEDRYGSPRALAEDLEHWLADEPVSAWPEPWAVRTRRWVGRHQVLVTATAAAVVVAMVLLAGATALLTSANQETERQRDAARRETEAKEKANAELERANTGLEQSRDDLERTLARSLLRPLGLQGAGLGEPPAPLTDPEIEALWELAGNRGERLGYRFVQEAVQGPVTTRQLRIQAGFALHAAVGLEPDKRTEMERLLVERLRGAKEGEGPQVDLALTAAALGDLSQPAATAVGQALVVAMGKTDDPGARAALAEALAAVAARMAPPDAARARSEAAAALVRIIVSDIDELGQPRHRLPEMLSAVAARLTPPDAARVYGQVAAALVRAIAKTDDPGPLATLAEALAAVAVQMAPPDAARVCAEAAATIARTTIKAPSRTAQRDLPRGLSEVAARTAPREAAVILAQAMAETTDPYALGALAEGLATVAARMGPRDAARVCSEAVAAVAQAMDKTTSPPALLVLAEGLSAVAARLGPQDAARACAPPATLLAQALAKTTDPTTLGALAEALSALAVRLGQQDAARACSEAAVLLTRAMVQSTHPLAQGALARGLSAVATRLEPRQAAATLTQTMARTTDPIALGVMAEALSGAAAGMEPRDAATTLAQTMTRTTDPDALRKLAEALVATAARTELRDAARVRSDAITALTQAMAKATDHEMQLAPALSALTAGMEPRDAAVTLARAMTRISNTDALFYLAGALAAVAARMEPQDAARACSDAATALTQPTANPEHLAARDALAEALSALAGRQEPQRAAITLARAMGTTTDSDAQLALAQALPAVMARMRPRDTTRARSEIAAVLIRAMAMIPIDGTPVLADSLVMVLTPIDAPETSRRLTIAATAVSSLAGPGQPFPSVSFLGAALEPLPCALSTQELVDLLKQPLCVGPARRVVLDQLGNRYRRPFADQWEFVAWAQSDLPDLDLRSPPKRPGP